MSGCRLSYPELEYPANLAAEFLGAFNREEEALNLSDDRIKGILEAISMCTERERQVVEARYKYTMTFEEIALKFDISKSRASAVLRQLFYRMRTSSRRRYLMLHGYNAYQEKFSPIEKRNEEARQKMELEEKRRKYRESFMSFGWTDAAEPRKKKESNQYKVSDSFVIGKTAKNSMDIYALTILACAQMNIVSVDKIFKEGAPYNPALLHLVKISIEKIFELAIYLETGCILSNSTSFTKMVDVLHNVNSVLPYSTVRKLESVYWSACVANVDTAQWGPRYNLDVDKVKESFIPVKEAYETLLALVPDDKAKRGA